jgi:hypothetical protein
MIFFAVVWMTAAAGPKYRAVVVDTICHAPIEAVQQTAAKFCRQFQACPDSLFDWAYVGLEEDQTEKEKTKESRDAIQLRYKERTYDPKTMKGDVAIDIYVLGIRWWKDTHLGSQCTHTWSNEIPQRARTHLTATYSGSLLEGGNCIFEMEALTPVTTQIHYTFDFTFGQMLAFFISDKVWQNAIAWRFPVILKNIVENAEQVKSEK